MLASGWLLGIGKKGESCSEAVSIVMGNLSSKLNHRIV